MGGPRLFFLSEGVGPEPKAAWAEGPATNRTVAGWARAGIDVRSRLGAAVAEQGRANVLLPGRRVGPEPFAACDEGAATNSTVVGWARAGVSVRSLNAAAVALSAPALEIGRHNVERRHCPRWPARKLATRRQRRASAVAPF